MGNRNGEPYGIYPEYSRMLQVDYNRISERKAIYLARTDDLNTNHPWNHTPEYDPIQKTLRKK